MNLKTHRIWKILLVSSVLLAMTACGFSAENTEKTLPDETAAVSQQNHLIDIGEIENARQLGGYIGAGGRRVKDNVLIRTARIDDISDETAQKLAEEYHVKYIVDFRMGYERQGAPDKEITGAQNVWISVFELDTTDPKNIEMMKKIQSAEDELQKTIEYAKSGQLPDLYTQILLSEQGQQGYARFFDILVNNTDGAVLWHCTYGKDRTGVAAALVLYALGVDEDVIMEDFLLSNLIYEDKISYLQGELRKRDCENWIVDEAQAMAGVKGEYLKAAFDAVRAKYGSVEAYMKSQLGVSDVDMETLRNRYLEESFSQTESLLLRPSE